MHDDVLTAAGRPFGGARAAQDQGTDRVEQARAIILAEAAALGELARALDARFETAIELIFATEGRVLLSGIGKSGHVARKIASTFASLGIAAHFIHPTEAAHGDLGAIATDDLVVVLSNSGATREVIPLARHAGSIGVPVIAITSRRLSPLARMSRVCLELPIVEEGGPSRLAPTSSTAMMMALGDALALGAMKARGLSRSGFGALHPGGAIASLLEPASALMHGAPDIPLVSRATPMREAILTMTGFRYGITGVVDDAGSLIGVITDGDLRRHIGNLLDLEAGGVMTENPVSVAASAHAEEAMRLMNQHKITAIFVVDDRDPSAPVGLIHVHDFLGRAR